jgi:hypothetical protein
MGPNPKPSFSSLINNLELHPQLKALLLYSLYNKKPPRGLFDNASYYYYNVYVKPKLTIALKNKHIKVNKRRYFEYLYKTYNLIIYMAPSYVIYEFITMFRECTKSYVYENGVKCEYYDKEHYHYLFGVDNDRVFINRVNWAPQTYFNEIEVNNNIKIRTIDNNKVYDILGYSIDMGDKEEIVIDVNPTPAINIRVQGDIVLTVLSTNWILNTIGLGLEAILNHVHQLLLDIINRILLEHGISATVRRNRLLIESVAPRKNDKTYLDKLTKLLAKELQELFNNIEIIENTIYIVDGDYKDLVIDLRLEGGGLNNPYNHIAIIVRDNMNRIENNNLTKSLHKELLNAFENLTPITIDFNLGNHYIKLHNVKPLSFTFRPSIQPLTLNENIITITNPLTFLVTPNSTIELLHQEHGLKVIKFKNTYVIRFGNVNTHRAYLRERNRVILRNLEL